MALALMGNTLPQPERGMLLRTLTAAWLNATGTGPVFPFHVGHELANVGLVDGTAFLAGQHGDALVGGVAQASALVVVLRKGGRTPFAFGFLHGLDTHFIGLKMQRLAAGTFQVVVDAVELGRGTTLVDGVHTRVVSQSVGQCGLGGAI